MLEKLIEFVVNNKYIVLLFTFIIIAWGVYSLIHTPIDAIPDLSDVQVIIISEWMGQSPQEVEDQVTFPLTSAMLAVPKVTSVRGFSYFGFSLVYVIFEDGTDIYWARSRVLEYMNYVASRLPEDVTSSLGPDATGVGWVYQYVVEPLEGHQKSLGELRSIQDWYVRYQLATVPGVAEVASIGGFVMQYQVNIDPDKLLAYNIPINKVMMAIRNSNKQAGARLLEMSGTEYMVRGLGYIENLDDLKNVVVGHNHHNGTPILVKDIGYVQRGPDLRRGLAEKDGKGEAVGGIVVMRFGENALEIIDRVKQKIEEIKPGLDAEGVKIVPVYDRSSLINRSIETLIEKLLEQIIIVALVCVLFLWHVRSAFVVIATLPLSILISLIIMKSQGLNANIMSLGGIAIAIGTLIDASIVMVEHAHKLTEQEGEHRSHWEIMIEAAKQVGPSLFFALLIITVSFMPIFTLEAQEGRLFKPLAFTKTYAMAAGALVSITLVPVLMGFFVRGKITPQEKNPIARLLIRAYRPVNRFVLRFPWLVILLAILVLLATYFPLRRLGSEFMPSLNEGDVLYMPTTRPGISITEARSLLQIQDKILADKKRFPEVKTVFGKIGRAETATDPAPLSMVETTITLKQPPPSFLGRVVRKIFFPAEEEEYDPGQKIRNIDEVSQAMLEALDFPGVRNAYPEGPIKTRIDMQATGIKTPVGIKVTGDDLQKIQDIAEQIGQVVQDVPGTVMVYPDRVMDGNYVNFDINREEAARYGLTVGQVQDVIKSAIGGMNITTTVEGRERYPVNLRYARELRENIDDLKRVLVPTMMGQQIPLGQLADIRVEKGPAMIKSENAMLQALVLVDKERSLDVGTYVKRAKAAVDKALARGKIELPGGYNIFWSGQYEYMQRAQARLRLIIPITIGIIFLLLYFNFKNITESLIVILSLPFATVGGIWLMYLMNFDMSIAVGAGFIALGGVAVENCVVMLVFLDLAYRKRQKEGPMTKAKLYDAIAEGAVMRIRPIIMTVVTDTVGLLPLFWGIGTGTRVMRRIAAPMIGGLISSAILSLVVIPAIYLIWKRIVIWRSVSIANKELR